LLWISSLNSNVILQTWWSIIFYLCYVCRLVWMFDDWYPNIVVNYILSMYGGVY